MKNMNMEVGAYPNRAPFTLGVAIGTDTSSLQQKPSWPHVPPPKISSPQGNDDDGEDGDKKKKVQRERPVVCTINNCGRRFSSDNSLRNHIRRKHSSRAILGRPSEYAKRSPLGMGPPVVRPRVPPLSPMNMPPGGFGFPPGPLSPGPVSPLGAPPLSPLSPAAAGVPLSPAGLGRVPSFSGHLAPPRPQPIARSLSVDAHGFHGKVPPPNTPQHHQTPPSPGLSAPTPPSIQRRHSMYDHRRVLANMNPHEQARAVDEIKDWLAARICEVTSQLATSQNNHHDNRNNNYDDDISGTLAGLDLGGLGLALQPQQEMQLRKQLQALQNEIEYQHQSGHNNNDNNRLSLGALPTRLYHSTSDLLQIDVSNYDMADEQQFANLTQDFGGFDDGFDNGYVHAESFDLGQLKFEKMQINHMDGNAGDGGLQPPGNDLFSMSCPASLYGSYDFLPGQEYPDEVLEGNGPQFTQEDLNTLCNELKSAIDVDFLLHGST